MTDWTERILPTVKKLDKLFKDKPFLKEIVTDIIHAHKSSLRSQIEPQLDDVLQLDSVEFVRCLVAGYRESDFYTELISEGFDEHLVVYLLKLSLTYGRDLFNLYVGLDNKIDWNLVETQFVMGQDGEKFVHLNILRDDGEILSLRGDRRSILNLIERIVASQTLLIYNDTLTQKESEIINDIRNSLDKLESKKESVSNSQPN